MNDDTMTALPAEQLDLVVNRVLEHNSPLAGDAQLVADEILRLRDAGQLSKETAQALAWFIYQRQMHSWHSGDFKVMEPIEQLAEEIDSLKREHFPATQVDPVLVHPRIADIAAGIALTTASEPDVGQDQPQPVQAQPIRVQPGTADVAAGIPLPKTPEPDLGAGRDQADVLVAIAREVTREIAEGWDQIRFEAGAVGNFTSFLTYISRDGEEERASPPFVVVDQLDELKAALHQPDTGTWVSLVVTLSAAGELDVHYNYDEKPDFGFEVSAHDYSLELQRFPRAEEAVPAWWQARIAQGDPL